MPFVCSPNGTAMLLNVMARFCENKLKGHTNNELEAIESLVRNDAHNIIDFGVDGQTTYVDRFGSPTDHALYGGGCGCR